MSTHKIWVGNKAYSPDEYNQYTIQNENEDNRRMKESESAARAAGRNSYSWVNSSGQMGRGFVGIASMNNTNGSASTSGNYGTGASNSNSAFSWNNEDMQKGMWQQAKDMSQLQLDNTLKTMGAASGYRSQELNLNDEITRRQNQQQFGFQKQLADDNYAFRDRDRAERERASDEAMERSYQMKTETTNAARQAASNAFYGGGNRAFRSFNRFRARG